MKCPICKKELELEETYTYWNSDTEIEIEEHWWCPECDNTPARFATYNLVSERWEE